MIFNYYSKLPITPFGYTENKNRVCFDYQYHCDSVTLKQTEVYT